MVDWDRYDDTDWDWGEYWDPPKRFSELYPEFDTGESEPGKVYPVEHGTDCKGHFGYSDNYKWAYVRVPPVPFQNDINVVWPREEYL